MKGGDWRVWEEKGNPRRGGTWKVGKRGKPKEWGSRVGEREPGEWGPEALGRREFSRAGHKEGDLGVEMCSFAKQNLPNASKRGSILSLISIRC